MTLSEENGKGKEGIKGSSGLGFGGFFCIMLGKFSFRKMV